MHDEDYLYVDWDDLSLPERIKATEAARRAAWGHEGPAHLSPWAQLGEDDPRTSAFLAQLKKERAAK